MYLRYQSEVCLVRMEPSDWSIDSPLAKLYYPTTNTWDPINMASTYIGKIRSVEEDASQNVPLCTNILRHLSKPINQSKWDTKERI